MALKVGEVGRDGNTGARVPDDWTRIGFGAKRFAHTRGGLKSHAERRGMTRQVDVRKDLVGGDALTSSERRDCERIWRVGGWHRAVG